MSDLQYRGFIIRYDPHDGQLTVFGEGSDVSLLHFEDTNEPLDVNYFSFATWHNRIVQVVFNCVPKDKHSTADIHSLGKSNFKLSLFACFLKCFRNEFTSYPAGITKTYKNYNDKAPSSQAPLCLGKYFPSNC